jgi:8-oxo-dGTP diphosphatase
MKSGGAANLVTVPEVVASTWACVRGRRLLVVRPADVDVFYVPGGKPEPGETMAEAAVREVREETRAELPLSSLRKFTEIVAPAHGRPGTDVRLIAFLADSDADPVPAAEIAELAWFTTADAPRCAPAIRILLTQLATAGLVD